MSSAPVWRISGGRRLTPAPFLVAGIINLTPDSFSSAVSAEVPPGDLEAALALARLHLEQGAHILDLGAESTRPGARDIGHDEEWRRLAPALGALLDLRAALPCPAAPAAPPFCISIDTFRAATARKALTAQAGSRPGGCLAVKDFQTVVAAASAASAPSSSASSAASAAAAASSLPVDIVNDISGGLFDPEMDALLGACQPGYVLCHCPARPAVMQNRPRYKDVLDEVESFFVSRLSALVKAGLPEECVALDPGIGFGKSQEHNLALLRALPRFRALGRPLYLGLSRKSFLGGITGLPLDRRGPATAVAVALTAKLGATIQRVHDVGQAMAALKLALALSE